MSTITTGAAAVPSLSHDWRDQHASWNQGAMDGWLLTHVASDGDANGSFTMGYYTQEDIPFHWALAQSFTLLDNYHCSVMGPTDPNRLFWEHGANDPQGKAGGPVLETGGAKDLTYETALRDDLQRRVQLQVVPRQRLDRPERRQLLQAVPDHRARARRPVQRRACRPARCSATAPRAGSATRPTRRRRATRSLAFEEDCANGVLPDVSFIGTGAVRAPARHPGGRRAVPRVQARGPGRQRGPVEQHRVRPQLRRERRVLRPRRPAHPRPEASTPRSSSRLASPSRHPRRRPAGRRRVPGARPSSSRRGRSAAGSSPRSPTTPPACG